MAEDDAASKETFAHGRYVVLRQLGAGSRKRVLLASDVELQRRVALAVVHSDQLDANGRAEFLREAKTMARLDGHANLVQIHDVGEQDGVPYLVLEYADGGTLAALVAAAGADGLPLATVIALNRDTFQGLQFIHCQGLIHGDLTPANILVASGGTAKVGDLGLSGSRPRQRPRAGVGATIRESSVYVAPEVAAGDAATVQADLYSAGCILYAPPTGRPPLNREGAPPDLISPQRLRSDCPAALDRLVVSLLQRDPALRPASAAAVLDLLRQLDSAGWSPASHTTHTLRHAAATQFVGRAAELRVLREAMDRALAGSGQIVALHGEPGIGKSRTARELAGHATRHGVPVLWGRCPDDEGVPPYWPWGRALGKHLGPLGPELLAATLADSAPLVAGIVPELSKLLPDIAPPATDASPTFRFRLHDAITSVLLRLAANDGLVLVLDDLHWADHATLQLLEFASHELQDSRLLLIVTYRDADLDRPPSLQQTLGELARHDTFRRVGLQGLGLAESQQLIQHTTGVEPELELAAAVHERTNGNPFFLGELIRWMGEERPGGRGATAYPDIPDGVRDTVQRRVQRLSASTRRLLPVIALLGDQFDSAELHAVVEGDDAGNAGAALDELLAARLIVAAESAESAAPATFEFTHAIIQETLVGALAVGERSALHERIADGLERYHGGTAARAHAERLAHHFASADPARNAQRLVYYSQLAGEHALQQSAREDAARHFNVALEALRRVEPHDQAASTETEAELRFGLGQALAWVGWEGLAASENIRAAFELFLQCGRTDDAVAAASYQLAVRAADTGTRRMLERALELTEPGTLAAAGLQQRLAETLVGFGDRSSRVSGLLERALQVARNEGDRALESRCLTAVARVTAATGAGADVSAPTEANLREAVAAAEQYGDPHLLSFTHHVVASVMHHTDLERAHVHRRAAQRGALRIGDPFLIATTSEKMAARRYDTGDLTAARAEIDCGLHAMPDAVDLLLLRAQIALEAGRDEDGTRDAGLALDGVAGSGEYAANPLRAGQAARRLGRLALLLPDSVDDDTTTAGDTVPPDQLSAPATAQLTIGGWSLTAVVNRLVEVAINSEGSLPAHVIFAWSGAGGVAIAAGDRTLAAHAYRQVVQLLPPASGGRTQARLARAAGDLQAAERFQRQAISHHESRGEWRELAWAHYELAVTLLVRGRRGDRRNVKAHLATATELAQKHGLVRLRQRIDAVMAAHQVGAERPPPDGLTERELEVIQLLAQGLTDKQIGERLFIAGKTVSNHVTHIRTKTGCANRAEVVRYAGDRQLLDR